MIAIQKISSLGFSINDGMFRPHDSLNENEKRTAVKRIPSLIEFFAFVLQFPTLMSGPTVTFHDYMEFVDGTQLTNHIKHIDKANKPSPIVSNGFGCISIEV